MINTSKTPPKIVEVHMEDGIVEKKELKIRSILKSDKVLMWKAKDSEGKIWSNVELAGRKVKVGLMTVDVYDDSLDPDLDLEEITEDRFLVPSESVELI
jgi:hypothetical protein